MATSQVTVGYWNARGRGGVIRSLLAYCGIPFTNKVYADRNEWFTQDKPNLGFEYPNVPYLIDGDKKLTETAAILSYIAFKTGKKELIGSTDDQLVAVQVALGVVADLRSHFFFKVALAKTDAEKQDALTNGPVKDKLEVLNKNLEGKEWLTGSLTVADFELFEEVEKVQKVDASKLEKYTNLVSFQKRFSEIPAIKAFKESPQFIA